MYPLNLRGVGIFNISGRIDGLLLLCMIDGSNCNEFLSERCGQVYMSKLQMNETRCSQHNNATKCYAKENHEMYPKKESTIKPKRVYGEKKN